MKRVLLLVTGLGVGGAEGQVVALATALHQRGWEVQVVSLTPPGPLAEDLRRAEIPVVSLGMRSRAPYPWPVARLVHLLRSWKPHIVHAHMVHANILARLVRPLAPVPVLICTAHSTHEISTRANEVREVTWRERAYRLTDWLCDLTTQVSRAGLERYVRVKAVPSNKIQVVYNGIDLQKFRLDPVKRAVKRRELGLEDRFTWLAVGRIEPQKGYHTLLEAIALMGDARAVVLVAGQGSLFEEVRARAHKLGISERVRFLGAQGDIPVLMNAADAFVLPSLWEGFGLVLVEAMACQLPVVATDSGGPREILDGGRLGFLVPPGDPQALSTAMQRLMDLPQEDRRRMVEEARRWVTEHFALERIVDRWEALYTELLERSRTRPHRMAHRGKTR